MSDDDGGTGSLATIASGAGLVFGGRVVKLTSGFLSQIIMAHLLGVVGYGSVVLVNITMGVVALLATLGLSSGLERNVPYFEDDTEKARGVVKAAVQIGLVASALVSVGLFFGAPWIADVVFGDQDLELLLRIVAVGLPFKVLRRVFIATAKGSRDAKTHVVVRQVIHPPLNTILITAFILANYGEAGAVGGSVLATAITAVMAGFLAIRSLQFDLFGPTRRMHRQLLGFSVPLMLSAAMNLLIFQMDTVLVGVLLESGAAGIYNIAFQFRSLGMFFFFSFAFLLPPVMTRLEKTEDREEVLRTYQVTSKWMVFATVPIVVGFVLFPEVIVTRFFGPSYADAATALRILMLPVLLTVVLGANGRALVALGHNRINLWVNASVGIANVLLNLALIPLLGIAGAALATAVSLIARDLCFATALYLREKIYAPSRTMLVSAGATLLLAGIGYSLVNSAHQFSFSSALTWGIGYVLVYPLVITILGGIESEDERMISLLEDKVGTEFTPLRKVFFALQR